MAQSMSALPPSPVAFVLSFREEEKKAETDPIRLGPKELCLFPRKKPVFILKRLGSSLISVISYVTKLISLAPYVKWR